MFNSHATQDSINTVCDGGVHDDKLLQLLQNIDSERMPIHNLGCKETTSSRGYLNQHRTTMSPNLDSLLYNTAVAASDMRLQNNNQFGNISGMLQPPSQYFLDNIERQQKISGVDVHFDYSPKANTVQQHNGCGMFQGLLFDILPDEEELKQLNSKQCKTFQQYLVSAPDQNNFGCEYKLNQQVIGCPSDSFILGKQDFLTREPYQYEQQYFQGVGEECEEVSGNFLIDGNLSQQTPVNRVFDVTPLPQRVEEFVQDQRVHQQCGAEFQPIFALTREQISKKRDRKKSRKSLQKYLSQSFSQLSLVHQETRQCLIKGGQNHKSEKALKIRYQQQTLSLPIRRKISKMGKQSGKRMRLSKSQNKDLLTDSRKAHALMKSLNETADAQMLNEGQSRAQQQSKSFGNSESKRPQNIATVLKIEYPFNHFMQQPQVEAVKEEVVVSSRSGRQIKHSHQKNDDFYYPGSKFVGSKRMLPPKQQYTKKSNSSLRETTYSKTDAVNSTLIKNQDYLIPTHQLPGRTQQQNIASKQSVPQIKKANIAIPLFRKVEEEESCQYTSGLGFVQSLKDETISQQQSPMIVSTSCSNDEFQQKDFEESKLQSSYLALRDEDSDSDVCSSSSSSSEELIDDEVYLQRHLNYEIDEIKRYNIGVKSSQIQKPKENRNETLLTKQVSHQLKIDDAIKEKAKEEDCITAVATPRQRLDSTSCSNRPQLMEREPSDNIQLMSPGQQAGCYSTAADTFTEEQKAAQQDKQYNLRRKAGGKRQDQDFVYDV